MKQLIITNSPFPRHAGGSEEKLFNQIKCLSSKGINIELHSSKSEEEMKYNLNGYTRLTTSRWNYKTFDNNLLFKIVYFILFHFFFIIDAYNYYKDKKFNIIEVKDPYSGIAGVWLKKKLGIPLVLETAGAFGNKMNKLYKMKFGLKSKFISFFLGWIERYVYRNCDVIITEDNCEEYMRNKGFTGKYYRIPNGVDTTKFVPSNKKTNTMLYLGRLNPEKNVEYIIKNKPEGKLVIVGSGLCENELKKYSSKDVIFEGFKSNTLDYYQNADVVIMSSFYESLPCVVLEAMSCGVPVVSTNVGMIGEVISNGVDGFVYELNDIEDFKYKVHKAMNNKFFGVRAREKMVKTYDWNKIVDKYLEVYNGIKKNNR